jgi:acyl-CoA thioester hydrolase
MPRIKLSEYTDYTFSIDYTLRIYDMNLGNHLGHAEMVHLLHEARSAFLKSFDASEINLGDGTTGVVVGDLAVNYKGEGFYGDTVTIQCGIGEIKDYGFRVFYKVTRGETLLALGESGHVSMDFSKGERTPVPESFIQKVRN